MLCCGKGGVSPITGKDWLDLSFGSGAGADASALSFVKVGRFRVQGFWFGVEV